MSTMDSKPETFLRKKSQAPFPPAPITKSTSAVIRTVDHSGDLSVKGTLAMLREWMKLSSTEDFVKFCEMSMSLRSWAAYIIFICLLQFPFYSYSYLLDVRDNTSRTNVLVAIFALVAMLLLGILNCMVFTYFYNKKRNGDTAYNRALKPYISTMRSALVLGMNAFYGFRLLSRTFRGECSTSETILGESWNCNPQANINGLPPESVYILMSGQILFIILFRDVKISVFIASWLECMLFLGAAMVVNRARSFFPTAIVFLFISFFVLVETARHHLSLYLVTLQLKEALKENELMSDQMHATEMRHMIANVAHDLKTPLTSFLSGIELIADVALDLQKRTSDGRATAQYVQDNTISILNCVNNIRNTNSFMLMTINRCIDYTKASKGLKLVPKFETIDLMETLSLPLNCMKDIQQRVVIQLQPIPKDICSHIITDRQWLQENVLCLLSNAVKYSGGGTVTICLYVVPGSHRNSKIKKKPSLEVGGLRHAVLGSASPYNLKAAQIYPLTPTVDSADEFQASDNGGIVLDDVVEAAPYAWPHESKDLLDNHNGEYLRIEIEDCGIGLSEEAMSNLFNPFKQAQRLAGGTGLGLYSLARRVEALNGYYGVDHRRDGEQGSMFWFSIPYRPDKISAGAIRRSMFPRKAEGWLSTIVGSSSSSRDEGVDRERERTLSVSGVGSAVNSCSPSLRLTAAEPALLPPPLLNPSSLLDTDALAPSEESSKCGVRLDILLVDDSPAIIKMTSMMLRRLGHTITIAENGDAALKKIWERLEETRAPFDVVLMDLQMPVMDGLEATRRLRTYELSYLAESLQPSTGSMHGSPSRALHGRMPKALSERTENNNIAVATTTTVASTRSVLELDTSESVRTHTSSPIQRFSSQSSTTTSGKHHQFVIGVSANSDHGTMQEALKAGVDAFMSKPFTIETFYDTYEKMKSSRLQA